MSRSSDTTHGTIDAHWWPTLVLILVLLTAEAIGTVANQLEHKAVTDPAVTLGP